MKKFIILTFIAIITSMVYAQPPKSILAPNNNNAQLPQILPDDDDFNYTVVAPKIDGIIEEIWNDVTPVPISNIIVTENFNELNAHDINCYEIISPLNAATNIPLKTAVKINFCVDSLLVGAGGSITISDQSAVRVLGVNYFIYNINPEMICGNSLSFLASGLQENKLYSIYIPYGAVADSKGNPFAGITDPTSWSFTTGDFTYPIVTVDARYVFSFDGIADPIAITSSVPGTVYLARSDISANAEALFAAIAQDKAVAATIVIAGSVTVDAEGLLAGIYNAYAIGVSGRIGVASNVVTVYNLIPNPYRMIRQIQGETTESPLVGNKVRTMGIVTAITNSGFFMQDENKPWSGIFVNTTGSVTVGSTVDIIGTVSEDKGLTTIGNVEGIIFTPPILLATSITIGSEVALSEMYESVFVKVTGRAATGGNVSSDWTILSANGINYKINNSISGTDNIKKDYEYSVTGIVIPSGADYKILAINIVNESIINSKPDISNSIKVFPNPFDNLITLNVPNGIKIEKAVITNITGQLVKEVIDPDNKFTTGELYKGVYLIYLQTQNGIIKTERIIKR